MTSWCGEPGALLVTVNVAAYEPTADGSKVTSIAHCVAALVDGPGSGGGGSAAGARGQLSVIVKPVPASCRPLTSRG